MRAKYVDKINKNIFGIREECRMHHLTPVCITDILLVIQKKLQSVNVLNYFYYIFYLILI